MIRSYFLRVLIAVDVLLMTLIFFGKRGEILSAAAWSLEQSGHFFGLFRPLIDVIMWPLERDHCALSWLNENVEPT